MAIACFVVETLGLATTAATALIGAPLLGMGCAWWLHRAQPGEATAR